MAYTGSPILITPGQSTTKLIPNAGLSSTFGRILKKKLNSYGILLWSHTNEHHDIKQSIHHKIQCTCRNNLSQWVWKLKNVRTFMELPFECVKRLPIHSLFTSFWINCCEDTPKRIENLSADNLSISGSNKWVKYKNTIYLPHNFPSACRIPR